MDFVQKLRDVSQPRQHQKHPLVRHLESGAFHPDHLLSLASAFWGMAQAFPYNLARVLSLCPDRTTRRHLLDNLLEEEGFHPSPSGLVDRPERSHLSLNQAFVQAVERFTQKKVPEPVKAASWFYTALDRGNWLGPAAYFMVGMELNVPPTFALLIPLFKTHFGFNDGDLIFFSEHLEADVAHGEMGIQILQSVCMDTTSQALALEGARRGALAWWSFWRYP